MNYGSSFAWFFKYKTITYTSTFICYQDVSLGHLFARASLGVHLLNLPNKPLFNWYHHFCIKHRKLYIFYFLKSYVLIKHWLEHWWTAISIYATSHNIVIISKHFLRLHFKKIYVLYKLRLCNTMGNFQPLQHFTTNTMFINLFSKQITVSFNIEIKQVSNTVFYLKTLVIVYLSCSNNSSYRRRSWRW